MTPRQIELVQSTFKLVAGNSEVAAKLFYERLFEIDPKLKSLFKGDMKEQGKKLMATIGVAVSSLNNLDRIIPTVQKLGASHWEFGVKDKDYETVATALLWTLKKALGAEFTREVEAAWTETYMTLANVMIEAAHKKPMEMVFKTLFSQAMFRLPEFSKI